MRWTLALAAIVASLVPLVVVGVLCWIVGWGLPPVVAFLVWCNAALIYRGLREDEKPPKIVYLPAAQFRAKPSVGRRLDA